MKITVNGEIRELEKEVDLAGLLDLLSLPSQRVAVELNREVIPKRNWNATIVRDDDRVEIVHFVGGG